MKYRRLGRTELRVSRFGLGSGGHDPLGQRSGVPESEIHRLIHHALDKDVNFFDTAPPPVYLESESIVGRALKHVPRDRYVLSTKVNLVPDPDGDIATPEEIEDSVDESLRRLRVSEVDLLLLGGQLKDSMYPRIIDELLPVVKGLQSSGKVRFLGTTEKSAVDGAHAWVRRVLRDDFVDVVMVAYNMINQSAERSVFPVVKTKDLGSIGIYTVRNVFSDRRRLKEVVAELNRRGNVDGGPDSEEMEWFLDLTGRESPVRLAYRYVLANETVSTVMTGTLDVDHLEENLRLVDAPELDRQTLGRLRRLFGRVEEAIGN